MRLGANRTFNYAYHPKKKKMPVWLAPPAGASILLVSFMVELQALFYISTSYKLALAGKIARVASHPHR